MDLKQLKQELRAAFPKMWIKDGAEFDSRHANSLWTGEGSMHTVVFDIGGETEQFDMPVFDMYSEFEMYEMGVLKQVADFLRARGFYAEAYDGGTFFIYKV